MSNGSGTPAGVRRRADVVRNEKALLDAAAAVFVEAGVDAPVRQIATRAGVGVATIYRHFPTRADLVAAVYRRQIDVCEAEGPRLLADSATPYDALRAWVDLFVDFLVTKHGLASALQHDATGFAALHAVFVERLVPVLAELLAASTRAGDIVDDIDAYRLMRAVGNLCAGAEDDPNYDARQAVRLLLNGCRVAAHGR